MPNTALSTHESHGVLKGAKFTKFSLLEQLRTKPHLSHLVPEYLKIAQHLKIVHPLTVGPEVEPEVEKLIKAQAPCILRSSLKQEGNKLLHPGKSLSLMDIYSVPHYKSALKQVLSQKNLDQIILQKQIQNHQHMVMVCFNKKFYFESSGTKAQSFYTDLKTTKGTLKISAHILDVFLQIARAINCQNFICELGVKGERVFIYQLNPIASTHPARGFLKHFEKKNPPALKLVSKHDNTNTTPGVYIAPQGAGFVPLLAPVGLCVLRRVLKWLLKHENQKNSRLLKKLAFYNNLALLYYFKSFLKTHKGATFFDFYTQAQKNTRKPQSQHFKYAAILGGGSFVPKHPTLSGRIFYGTGKKDFTIGKAAFVVPSMDPKKIHALPPNSLVLGAAAHILGHGFLAAVEKDLCVVTNLTHAELDSFKPEQNIRVHFARKTITKI